MTFFKPGHFIMFHSTMTFSQFYLSSKSRWLRAMVAVVVVYIFVQVSWTSREYIRPCCMDAQHVSTSGFKEHYKWTCIDRLANRHKRVEDIYCIVLPEFLPHIKNPCFYDYGSKHRELRCLPYFYIIGMDKSASTDLHSRLAKHPLVMENRGNLGKETAYWSWYRYGIFNKKTVNRKMYLDDYLTMFADTAKMIQDANRTQIITGDATPMDLWDFRSWPSIPQNAHKEEPEVLTPHLIQYIHQGRTPKFIIQLREPVERLYSDYIFLKYGNNPTEFHKHSMEAIDLMNNCTGNHSRRFCYFSKALYQKLPARLHLGCYSVFLKEWFNVFPRSAFLITRTDEYMKDMSATLTRVFQFMDLPTPPQDQMADILNQTRRHVTQKKAGKIRPETVTALRKFYDDCNKETAELLQDDRFLWSDHYT
ncbi:unnamed protein product [Candidula unifasciata]|uniref:Sulfotransferase domain-containing protein n=1 Tax=Candidula unifasciata TaxID=100452 RepID=A0A8S4A3D5_9EUPU|nr:unnamed protein product [Candidula unifasciata]